MGPDRTCAEYSTLERIRSTGRTLVRVGHQHPMSSQSNQGRQRRSRQGSGFYSSSRSFRFTSTSLFLVEIRAFRRNSRWPQRGRGVAQCAGANDGPIALGNQRQPLAVTKRPCGSVVGRLLDTLDRDASVVSALQHSATFVLTATSGPHGMPDRPCVVPSACGPRR